MASCAAKTLDMTDATRFESSFTAVIAELSEEERLAFAGALLTLVNYVDKKTILPKHIIRGKNGEPLLTPGYREAYTPILVAALGKMVNGKTVEEVLALAEAVAAKAEANAVARQQGRLAELEKALALARQRVAAEKAEGGGARGALERRTAILEGVEVRIAEAVLSEFKGKTARGAFELEVVNRSGTTLRDAKLQLLWHAKGKSAKVKRYGLKSRKAIGAEGLAPQAGATLKVERVRLSFTKVPGGLDSPDQLSFSVLVDQVVTAAGDKIGRRSLEKERRALESGGSGLSKAEQDVERLEQQLEAMKAAIEGRS